MESLWHLEDKWKLSTNEAVLLLVCATSLLMGVCAATVLQRRSSMGKRNQLVDFVRPKWSETSCIRSWGGSVKRVLIATVRWSGASKWEEEKAAASWKEVLLGRSSVAEEPVAVSHNSESQVWQRPILMGEKCEMPRFSGLILYDQRGQPLNNEPAAYVVDIKKEQALSAKGRITLRDLL